MKFLRSRLFRLARSDLASYFIGYAFEFASRLIPVRRLFEDKTVIAFPHPVAFWETHYLIVPKRRIPSFASLDLNDGETSALILKIMEAAQTLGRENKLDRYAILVNGGAYQDVPQLHFHLASGSQGDGGAMYSEENVGEWMIEERVAAKGKSAVSIRHPLPVREFHYVLVSTDETPNFWSLDFRNPTQQEMLTDLLCLAQQLLAEHRLDRYTLLTNVDQNQGDTVLQFHLVSGDKVVESG